MGLRCLLGHDFGEPETERERNEEGNEVVVTVREVKTCERCGEKQVVSENKEITSIDQLRDSAAGEQSREESAPKVGIGSDAEEEWGDDDLATGQTDPATATEPEQPAEETATVEPDEDPIERGVADIIEQAEKDDDMLEQPPEEPESAEPEPAATAPDEPESAESEDDEPVHPGQRSAAAEESDAPDAVEDDGVILDDDAASPPEEGRHQWEEEASPGDELNVGDSATAEEIEEDDAEIIDASGSSPDSSSAEPSPEPSTPEDEPQQSSTPSAVESEDAEIVDADPEPATGPSDPVPESGTSQSEPASPEREETDEGHMPWPEGPGEDEGHDATPPEGEPADVDFGDFAPAEEQSSDAETDRANGHRTDEGEESEQSTAPTANVDLERSSRDAELEYFCPECGLTRDVGTSSMRAGDICPECHVGYISEQQKAE